MIGLNAVTTKYIVCALEHSRRFRLFNGSMNVCGCGCNVSQTKDWYLFPPFYSSTTASKFLTCRRISSRIVLISFTNGVKQNWCDHIRCVVFICFVIVVVVVCIIKEATASSSAPRALCLSTRLLPCARVCVYACGFGVDLPAKSKKCTHQARLCN